MAGSINPLRARRMMSGISFGSAPFPFRQMLKAELRRYGIQGPQALERALLQAPQGAIDNAMREMAGGLADEVRAVIENQGPGLNWPPLNPQYLEHKQNQQLDERMLIATGDYLQNIGVQHVRHTKRGLAIHVGVPPMGRHKGRDGEEEEITYERLAKIHEFGTDKIPARPHWAPAYLAFRARAPEHLRELARVIKEAVDENLKQHSTQESRSLLGRIWNRLFGRKPRES